MAFSELSEYSEGVFPECGMASSYTICEGAASYKPIDVSGLQGAIDSAISTAMKNARKPARAGRPSWSAICRYRL